MRNNRKRGVLHFAGKYHKIYPMSGEDSLSFLTSVFLNKNQDSPNKNEVSLEKQLEDFFHLFKTDFIINRESSSFDEIGVFYPFMQVFITRKLIYSDFRLKLIL